MTTPPKQFLSSAPVFHAKNFEATLNYYRDVLGFTVAWTNGDYASVAREEIEIHIYGQSSAVDLLRREPTERALDDFFVLVADVDSLYVELKANGADFLDEPADYPYGMREVHLRDPNGYVFVFSQSIEPSAPASG